MALEPEQGLALESGLELGQELALEVAPGQESGLELGQELALEVALGKEVALEQRLLPLEEEYQLWQDLEAQAEE